MFNLQPVSIKVDAAGRAGGLKMVRTAMDAPDAHWHCRAEIVASSEHILDADALGCLLLLPSAPHELAG